MGSQRRVSSGRHGETVEREVTLSWQASFHEHWGGDKDSGFCSNLHPRHGAPSLSHQGKATQELPQKEAPEEAGGEEQTEAFVLRSFSPAWHRTLRNPSAGCCALRGQGAEGVH